MSASNAGFLSGKIRLLLQKEFPWKRKLFLSALVGFSLSFVFFFFGILDVFISNHQEIPIAFMDVLLISFLSFFVVGLIVTGVLFAVPGKFFSVVLSLAVGLLMTGFLQGVFLNINLGELTGDRIPWEEYRGYALANTLIWLFVLAVPLAIRWLNVTMWRKTISSSCFLICGVLCLTLGINGFSSDVLKNKSLDMFLSVEGENELSSQRNIIVFVVDRLDYNYIDMVRKSDPAFFNRLDGFTDFTNATALHGRTYPSSAYMATGVKGFFDTSFEDYFNEAWTTSPYIPLLRDNNYTTKYHMDYGYTYNNVNKQLVGRADNLKLGRAKTPWSKLTKTFVKLSVYRYAPFCLKPSFWIASPDFKREIDVDDPQVSQDMVTNDDLLFDKRLTEEGLTVQNEKNNYLYLHLQGSHAPYIMDENAQYAGETDVVQQTKGIFHILYTYMDDMKKLGLYENATIVITGDHGKSTDLTPLDYASTIGFFVKPCGSAGVPLVQNRAPVSHENLWPTILKSEGFDSAPYGVSAFDVPQDSDMVRHFYYRWDIIEQDRSVLEHFEIRGDAKNFANWRKVEDIPIYHFR